MKFEELILNKRKELKETQEQFGKRFDLTAMAVSYIERGLREAPYRVLYFALEEADAHSLHKIDCHFADPYCPCKCHIRESEKADALGRLILRVQKEGNL